MNLNPSEEDFKVTENARELIAIFDHRFKIVFRNHLFNDVLGYNSMQMKDLGPMDLIHPDDFKKSILELRKTILSGKGKIDLRVMHENGHYIWVEIRGRSFLDKDGKKKGMMIAKDINERKIAELRLKDSLESLKQISR